MDAQAINTLSTLNPVRLPDRRGALSPVSRPSEPSEDLPPANRERDRSDLIAEIKKKIKAGYYGSRDVVEDLSDTFAKAFNQI
jgi:hypothetical protein